MNFHEYCKININIKSFLGDSTSVKIRVSVLMEVKKKILIWIHVLQCCLKTPTCNLNWQWVVNTADVCRLLAPWRWDRLRRGRHLGAADAVKEASTIPTFSQTTKLQPVLLLWAQLLLVRPPTSKTHFKDTVRRAALFHSQVQAVGGCGSIRCSGPSKTI